MEVRTWLSQWLPADAVMGAEASAWELARQLELARTLGEEVAGLALEWSQAFDRVPLEHLRAGL